MSQPMARRSWRDWVLFGAAYGVILGAILFAYPPSQGHGASRIDRQPGHGCPLK